MTAWNELLEEFRVLGGTAENIRLGHGEFGRGIFAVDPGRRVAIHVPDNLLVPANDMVFIGGALRVGPNSKAGDRERAWINRYQQEYSWGGDGANEVRKMFERAGALPAELRHALFARYRCGFWFDEPTDELIQSQFLQSRAIAYRGQSVLVPLVEMANHGVGPRFDTSDGVALRGTFPDEVLVQYSELDAYDYFLYWGFATHRPLAFSLALTANIKSTRLIVEQLYMGQKNSELDWIPEVGKNSDNITLSFLMIGNERYPRLPKGIFYRQMREAGYAGFEESFDRIHHVNSLHFIDLLQTMDGIELPIARTLRAVA